MDDDLTLEKQQAVRAALERLHVQGTGLAFGLLFGLALFAATNVLILKGGEQVGPHLALLGAYFPGYRVTVFGSVVGFVYAFVIGYASGRTLAMLYNWITRAIR